MRKLILMVHTTLDGFVAGPSGELSGFDASQENLEFVCEISEDADTALFGRKSYKLLDDYWPAQKDQAGATKGEVRFSNWYTNAQKIVFSKTMTQPDDQKTLLLRNNLFKEITAIKNQPGKNIVIFGSPSLSQELMQHNLIDEYWIFINPLFFGKGIPLFNGTQNPSAFKLLAVKPFANGEVALHYTP